jgi:hypothetical protein
MCAPRHRPSRGRTAPLCRHPLPPPPKRSPAAKRDGAKVGSVDTRTRQAGRRLGRCPGLTPTTKRLPAPVVSPVPARSCAQQHEPVCCAPSWVQLWVAPRPSSNNPAQPSRSAPQLGGQRVRPTPAPRHAPLTAPRCAPSAQPAPRLGCPAPKGAFAAAPQPGHGRTRRQRGAKAPTGRSREAGRGARDPPRVVGPASKSGRWRAS